MTLRDLRDRYGNNSTKQALVINRAIRAELPGGAEALDCLETLHKLRDRAEGQLAYVLDLAHAGVFQIVAAMENEIRRRYGIGA